MLCDVWECHLLNFILAPSLGIWSWYIIFLQLLPPTRGISLYPVARESENTLLYTQTNMERKTTFSWMPVWPKLLQGVEHWESVHPQFFQVTCLASFVRLLWGYHNSTYFWSIGTWQLFKNANKNSGNVWIFLGPRIFKKWKRFLKSTQRSALCY